MPILGSIIKAAIDVRGAITSEKDPIESQEEVLKDLLETAKDTAFGKYYGFSEILKNENIQKSFATAVPYFDYHQMEEKWWCRIHEGIEDICWPGIPKFMARSSGTTGKKSKKIPVTDEMIDAIQTAGVKQIGAMANFDMPSDFFEREIMMLGSSTKLSDSGQFLEGEISGISASQIPFWFKGYYKPGEEIALIEDWDERIETIAKNAKNWDIGALSGIPSWMELMLKRVMEYHHVESIHDIWPNLQAYATGGVAFLPYEKSFRNIFSKPVNIIETYLASEGFLAFQNRPETTSMKLITDNGIYFEFVPFKPEYILDDGSLSQDAPALTLGEVENDVDYVLIISTVSGAWRYLIGDTIKFTDVERAEIKITGRTKFFLNVVGSQLSVNKMEAALRELAEKFGINIPQFTISAVKINGEFYHHWYLGMEGNADATELADELDNLLKEANNNYKVARSKALRGVIVTPVNPEIFYEWNGHQKKKGGQVKMEKVMDEEKFSEWEKFVKSTDEN